MKTNTIIDKKELQNLVSKVVSKIAPVWSLENFVAVNPYMGLANLSFTDAMILLKKTAAHEATLPISFYVEAYREGEIRQEALKQSLSENQMNVTADLSTFLSQAEKKQHERTFANVEIAIDLACKTDEKLWDTLMVENVSTWAASHFDRKYAAWNTSNKESSLYRSWKSEAVIDRSLEVQGLKGFRAYVGSLSEDPQVFLSEYLNSLDLERKEMELYLLTLLMKCSGWASAAAKIDYDANMSGLKGSATTEFLAILAAYDAYFLRMIKTEENSNWAYNKEKISKLTGSHAGLTESLAIKLIFQQAYDLSKQQNFIEKFNDRKEKDTVKAGRPEVQSVFCIDVRSELMRRNLELYHDNMETIGFAGFFAFPIEYVPLAHEYGNEQCPVLLKPSHSIKEGIEDSAVEAKAVRKRSIHEQLLNAWKSFKLGAISCFSFVGPIGLAYLPKLFTDSFRLSRPTKPYSEVGLNQGLSKKLQPLYKEEDHIGGKLGINLTDRIDLAKNALHAMTLTDNFAKIILISGHGSSTVNNPHATGLDCGACGGNTGETNSRIAAAVLNEAKVRESLKAEGIEIPADTLFVAALHDTTTDNLNLLIKEESIPETHMEEFRKLRSSLELAGKACRSERLERMTTTKLDSTEAIYERSKDWSQVRPEWGLAGCSSFIVAPRRRTKDLNLQGKAFMHSYEWQKDKDFSVLELIITAPMVVTSWINLQYYASTVDNRRFGSGNKTLHNVVAGMGVQEGIEGDLRVGLPWQSVHDGKNYQHTPERLAIFIEAPVDEISKILEKHSEIQQLFDNQWLYLYAIDSSGKVSYKYNKQLEWDVV